MAGPNPFSVLRTILRARRLAPPQPTGTGDVDHSGFDPILRAAEAGGVDALVDFAAEIREYIEGLSAVDPDDLTRESALAYWLNLYNAAALDLAGRARAANHTSVLDIRAGFRSQVIRLGDESLTLAGIEHGKVRRFGDPRIHGALVCGSISCPTLRFEAYRGDMVDRQLDDQMRHFLAAGGFEADEASGVARISRVFLWYGADFVRPQRMPTLLPAPKRRIAGALLPWLSAEEATWLASSRPKVAFQRYDWSLGCAVRARPGTS